MKKSLLRALRDGETSVPVSSSHREELRRVLFPSAAHRPPFFVLAPFAGGALLAIILTLSFGSFDRTRPSVAAPVRAAEKLESVAARLFSPPSGTMIRVVRSEQIVPYDGETHKPVETDAYTVVNEVWSDGVSFAGKRTEFVGGEEQPQMGRKFLLMASSTPGPYQLFDWVWGHCDVPEECVDEGVVSYPVTTRTKHAELVRADASEDPERSVDCGVERRVVTGQAEDDPVRELLGWYSLLPQALRAVDGSEFCVTPDECKRGRDGQPVYLAPFVTDDASRPGTTRISFPENPSTNAHATSWMERSWNVWIDPSGLPVGIQVIQDGLVIQDVSFHVTFEPLDASIFSPAGWKRLMGIDETAPTTENAYPPFVSDTYAEDMREKETRCESS